MVLTSRGCLPSRVLRSIIKRLTSRTKALAKNLMKMIETELDGEDKGTSSVSISSVRVRNNTWRITTQSAESQAEAEVSVFRRSTTFDEVWSETETDEDRVKRITKNRGCLKSWPAHHSNDLVHGSWHYVWGSLLSCIIPISR